jgi:hypothetical protein
VPTNGSEGPVTPSARVFGAGAAPVTRIGQRNAEIRQRNAAVLAARRELEAAEAELAELEHQVREAGRDG